MPRNTHLPDRAQQGDPEALRIGSEHGIYWIEEFPRLGDKTRSSIVTTLTSTLYPFFAGTPKKLFATHTTIVPDLCREGLIVVLDLPIRKYGKAGAMGQQLFKNLWQLAMEQHRGDDIRPVFCWVDEAQFLMNDDDAEHLSVARSAKACNVFITQDIPTYYARIPKQEVADSLLGKFQTRIFHANTNMPTNREASELIGKVTKYTESRSDSRGRNTGGSGNLSDQSTGLGMGSGRNRNWTISVTEREDDAFPPHQFAHALRTGGPANKFKVDAIVVRNGKTFSASGLHYVKAEFSQR